MWDGGCGILDVQWAMADVRGTVNLLVVIAICS